MGAAGFAVVAVGFANDGRVIGGVATGVGFIGAGMIFHDSGRGIVGFATAAASWATVANGVLAGLGRAVVALAFAGMAILVLEVQYLGLTGVLRALPGLAPNRPRLRPGRVRLGLTPA